MLLALPFSAQAQQAGKKYRVGYLAARSGSGELDEAFKARLRELGYIDGQNISYVHRWADGHFERLPSLAEELLQLKVDIIVTETTAAAQAAKKATQTVPILMASSGDAVGAGLVASLARPGGNVTGMTFLGTDLAPKWVELMKEIIPKAKRLGFFAMTALTPETIFFQVMEPEAKKLGMTIRFFDVKSPTDYKDAFHKMRQSRMDAVIVAPNTIFAENRKQIVELAAQHRLPALYSRREQVEAGGLISYGQNYLAMHSRAAEYADRLLKGTKPADLPVERLPKYEFIVNLIAAKKIGLTIPPNVLVRADKVIR